jgi:hypothetical protein
MATLDITGPELTSMELARPGGQTSNSLLETLAGWSYYLESHPCTDSESRHHENVGSR